MMLLAPCMRRRDCSISSFYFKISGIRKHNHSPSFRGHRQ
ncbi:hypothetical protein X805_40270 [Sphaerotilus natans subsp. natans DSM 6575]|uniref:Uncharacterized protein n=1 Tax=Sphaerotilus natans subsp. natans DSM 6575 TaxID=1286631 RepID=A0A059KFZ9_9BURK|nr:hypothetical protein X805_40270 [Sphaerotilus natans subsp. natans DSM 6575]